MPHFLLEDQVQGIVAGIDEVGRGPWAGPVVACAFVFHDRAVFNDYLPLINDSKKMSPSARKTLSDIFHQQLGYACSFAIAQASVLEIDRLNIRKASLLAMQRAYEALRICPDYALVDGNVAPLLLGTPVQTVIKGDQISYSIAAASIVAKVYRDQLMTELAQQYPYYAWERNAGYGTPAHQSGLAIHGVTHYHRASFSPIKKYLAQESL